MLISKFNRMIRNKFLWGFFAVIICLFFVGGSLKTGGCSKTETGSVGSVNGNPVSRQQLEKAILYELGFQQRGQLSDSELASLEEQAWKRIATLQHADELGVTCTKQEIDAIIVNDPRFQVNGVFDPDRYEAAVRQELGIPGEMLEEYMAQEIVLNRMSLLAASMVLTPPSELSQKLERLTDICEVEYAFLTNEISTAKVKVSDEEVQNYFEENIDLFRIPEKMDAQYVQFPVNAYTGKVTVSRDDALDYYESNISDYSSRNTNDELVTVAFTNVEDQIRSELVRDKAAFLAKDHATEFVMDLMPDRDGTVAPLQDVATKYELTLRNTPLFSMFEQIEEIDAGYDFNRAAFSLVPSDPERSISDAIVGSSNVYVIIAGEKVESRLPTFNEVQKEAETFAKRRKANDLFEEKAQALRSTFTSGAKTSKDFKAVLEKEDLEVISSAPFSVYSDMTNEIEHSELIVPSAIALDAGDTSELIPTSDGYLLIHMTSREPGDLLAAELLKPQLVSAVSRYRGSVMFEEMQNALFKQNVIVNDDKQDETEEES